MIHGNEVYKFLGAFDILRGKNVIFIGLVHMKKFFIKYMVQTYLAFS